MGWCYVADGEFRRHDCVGRVGSQWFGTRLWWGELSNMSVSRVHVEWVREGIFIWCEVMMCVMGGRKVRLER